MPDKEDTQVANVPDEPGANAWLVSLGGGASFSGFSARVDGSDAAGIREGDGISCISSADGSISAFGRAYRVRTDGDGATIYTDAVLVLESPVNAAAHGITANTVRNGI